MGQIKIETTITISDVHPSVARPPIRTRNAFSVTAIEDKTFAVSADATVTIWDPTTDSTEATSDFDVMILIADGTLDVELTCNEGDSNEELFTVRLVKDVPLILAADDAYYNHSASNAFGGTLDVIDKIRVDEPNSAARKLRMILGT